MQTEQHQRFFQLFSICNLRSCKFIVLKESTLSLTLSLTLFNIITVITPSTFLRLFFMGRSGFEIKEETGEGFSRSCLNFLTSFFCWMSFPPHPSPCLSLDCRPHIRKNSFQTNFNILLVAHIFSFTITTYVKRFIGIKSLITRQCPAESSP